MRHLVFILLSLGMFYFTDLSHSQNKINKVKLNQLRMMSHKEFMLVKLNLGLLYAIQGIDGIRASGVEFDEGSYKFVFKIEVRKDVFHYLSNSEKQKLINDLILFRIMIQEQFFLNPLREILENYPQYMAEILRICVFKFQKWYKAGGYEELPYPEKRDNESEKAHTKRFEKWLKDSEVFSSLAIYENIEVTLLK